MSPQTQRDIGAVEQLVARLEAAFNARDSAALAALYTEDAVLMPPNELPVQGRGAIQLWFDQALPRLGAIRLNPTVTLAAGDLAVQVGRFQKMPSAAGAGSTGAERSSKYILVFTRAGERWAICADLWKR